MPVIEDHSCIQNHVSVPYCKNKERSLDLKSLNEVFMEILFEFQTLVKLAKSVLDLLTLDLTSAWFLHLTSIACYESNVISQMKKS